MTGVQDNIDRALNTVAVDLGTAPATESFRKSLRGAITVPHSLTSAQKKQVQKYCDFDVVFTGGPPITHDHPVVGALRVVVRSVMTKCFGDISRTPLKTLCVGATYFEASRFAKNPCVHYYIYGSEAKDAERCFGFFRSLVDKLRDRVDRHNRHAFRFPGAFCEEHTVKKVYATAESLFRDYEALSHLPKVVHTNYVKANVLYFFDSIYNLGSEGICEAFEKTGASVGYGYGIFPMELLFGKMLKHGLYRYHVEGEYSVLTWENGYSSGYRHKTADWATILQTPVCSNGRISVCSEIVSRCGPMCLFKLWVSSGGERVVRRISLKDNEKFLRIADLSGSMRYSKHMKTSFTYRNVPEVAFTKTVNYLLSIDAKSMSVPNAMAYVRRQAGGVSLVNQELVAAWDLSPLDFYTLACVALLHAVHIQEKQVLAESLCRRRDWLRFFRSYGTEVLYQALPILSLLEYLVSQKMFDKLVLTPDYDTYQSVWCPETKAANPLLFFGGFENQDDVPSCPFCASVDAVKGEQEFICGYKESSTHEFVLTDAQVATFRDSCLDTDNDPAKLAKVKDLAAENTPKTAFSYKVRVEFITGGPGTGKSTIVRAIAPSDALVVGPLFSLHKEYTDASLPNGGKVTLDFKTLHRALATRGYKYIFFDEYTCTPYEVIAICAYNNSASKIFLVGDHRQCSIREPDEGLSVLNRIDPVNYSHHELLWNFRNPKDIVALLNKTYGYTMRAKSKLDNGLVFVDREPSLPSALRYAFSKATAEKATGSKDSTVRSVQGRSVPTSVLFVEQADSEILKVPCLQIVAISRSSEKCYVVCPEGGLCASLKAQLGWDEDFVQNMQQWLEIAPTTVRQLEFAPDPAVDMVLPNPPQSPMDSYLLVPEVVPAVTTALEGPLNDEFAVVSKGPMISGEVSEEFLCPVNARGHPMSQSRTTYAMTRGYGKHFDATRALEELRVVSERYFSRRPLFKLDFGSQRTVDRMVDLWLKECVKPEPIVIDADMIDAKAAEFLCSVRGKHYFEQFGGLDNSRVRDVRFFLKNMFKPGFGSFDVAKAGQGVSAWMPDLLSMFCLAFRVLEEIAVAHEAPNVLTDSFMSQSEFLVKMSAQGNLLPAGVLCGISDWIQYDSIQNEITQYVEYRYWTAHGVSEAFLKHYYSFRRNYTIVGDAIRGKCRFEKASGEPGTKLNNGVVSKVLSNALIRGQGPFRIAYKGDDNCKTQSKIYFDKELYKYLHDMCGITLTVKIQQGAEFCGLSILGPVMAPSIVRKHTKVVAHRYRDYEHFAETAKSVRNFLQEVETFGASTVAAVDAECHPPLRQADVLGMLEDLASISHLSESQFLSSHKKATSILSIPRWENGGVKLEYLNTEGSIPVSSGSARIAPSLRRRVLRTASQLLGVSGNLLKVCRPADFSQVSAVGAISSFALPALAVGAYSILWPTMVSNVMKSLQYAMPNVEHWGGMMHKLPYGFTMQMPVEKFVVRDSGVSTLYDMKSV